MTRLLGAISALALLAADLFNPAAAATPTVHIPVTHADRCEFLAGDQSGHCLLPFPSDHFTVADDHTDTGRRVHLARASMPANVGGVHVDPTEWNRSDGFSPGSVITVLVPGLDPGRSALPPSTDIGRSLTPDAPIVLLDADTGKRTPFWSELDAHAASPAEQALLVTPARALREGHRYVVALRGVRGADGTPLDASEVFRAYRDRKHTDSRAVEDRRDHMERLLHDLSSAGVGRKDLYLAWDFTVASERGLSERLLHMRDDAFQALGKKAPAFRVDEATLRGPARVVSGTFEVPRYLTGDGGPGQTLNNGSGPGGLPKRNGTQTADFVCTVPTGATADKPARMALFGHGLLGRARDVVSVGTIAAATNVAFCATDWIGLANGDIQNAVATLQDVSGFRSVPDRLQQADLNFLFLGRLMRHQHGLSSNAAFQDASGRSVLDRGSLFFVGNSQGGVLGAATTAVAVDWTRAFLGVPGMNYSVLIRRSVDFDRFFPVFSGAYPDQLDQQLLLVLAQMLWDRGENDGYAQHVTHDPYPHTPKHQVLMLEAFGDHQVANVMTESLARTMGVRLRVPPLADGRSNDIVPFVGLEPVKRYPFHGSALVVWDFGTPPPPPTNLPNRAGEDPHGKAADVPAVLAMASAFLERDGSLIDVCGNNPCQTLGT